MDALVVPGSSRKNYWQRRVENDRLIAAARDAGIELVIGHPMGVQGFDQFFGILIVFAAYLR